MADNNKPITVVELKTFIDAVEFAADTDEWVPSVRQWTRIRSMIDRLQESAPVRIPEANQLYRPSPEAMTPMALPMPGDPRLASVGLPPSSGLAGPFAQGGPSAVRAPDVDTSNGNTYKTPFA